MKEELNVLERKVELIKKLKNAGGESWINLRQDKEFQILARKYHSLNDDDIIAMWSRKMSRSWSHSFFSLGRNKLVRGGITLLSDIEW